MEVRDYNGPNDWSVDAVRERYREHCRRFGQSEMTTLVPTEHLAGGVRWIYPVMDVVIDGLRRGDKACVEIGIEFIESRHRQPFGRILHAKVARVLKRAALDEGQVARLRHRILQMLVDGDVPHEYAEYARLLRHIGMGTSWYEQRRMVDESNIYVMRYVRYFERLGRPEGTSK
jgi:hypothetical protein